MNRALRLGAELIALDARISTCRTLSGGERVEVQEIPEGLDCDDGPWVQCFLWIHGLTREGIAQTLEAQSGEDIAKS
jgi:hypothetical protein